MEMYENVRKGVKKQQKWKCFEMHGDEWKIYGNVLKIYGNV